MKIVSNVSDRRSFRSDLQINGWAKSVRRLIEQHCIWNLAINTWKLRNLGADMLSHCAQCANDLCVATDCVHRHHKSFERLIICLFMFVCHPLQVNIVFQVLAKRKVRFKQQISDFLFCSHMTVFCLFALPLFSGIFRTNV